MSISWSRLHRRPLSGAQCEVMLIADESLSKVFLAVRKFSSIQLRSPFSPQTNAVDIEKLSFAFPPPSSLVSFASSWIGLIDVCHALGKIQQVDRPSCYQKEIRMPHQDSFKHYGSRPYSPDSNPYGELPNTSCFALDRRVPPYPHSVALTHTPHNYEHNTFSPAVESHTPPQVNSNSNSASSTRSSEVLETVDVSSHSSPKHHHSVHGDWEAILLVITRYMIPLKNSFLPELDSISVRSVTIITHRIMTSPMQNTSSMSWKTSSSRY